LFLAEAAKSSRLMTAEATPKAPTTTLVEITSKSAKLASSMFALPTAKPTTASVAPTPRQTQAAVFCFLLFYRYCSAVKTFFERMNS
jgi:hypothetical protein